MVDVPSTGPRRSAAHPATAASRHRRPGRRGLLAAFTASAALLAVPAVPAAAQDAAAAADGTDGRQVALARVEMIGMLFASDDAAARLRTGVLRFITSPAPLPPPPVVIPNPATVEMDGAWDGEVADTDLSDDVAGRVSDLVTTSGSSGRLRPSATPTTTWVVPASTADGLTCPVFGPVRFINDWGFPRSGGRTHKGTDMFALEGTPIVTVRPAVITAVSHADRGLGGITVSYVDDRGDRWYNAHLSAVAAGVDVGMLVPQGTVIGYVGRTGNARTTPPHNHIQYHPGNGSPVNPHPLLAVACPQR